MRIKSIRKTMACFVAVGVTLSALEFGHFTASAVTDTSRFGEVLVSDTGMNPTIQNGNTSRKLAVSTDGTIYAAYKCDEGIRVAKSTNEGQSFSSSVLASSSSCEPEVATSTSGAVYVGWVESDYTAKLAKSTDGGVTFSAPVTIASNISSSTIHMATDGNHIYVIGRTGTDLYISADGGATFTTHHLSDIAYVFSDVHVDPTDHRVIVQEDQPSIKYYLSTDYGTTFGAEVDPGQSVYYSVGSIGSDSSGHYLLIAGSGSSGVKINLDTGTVTAPSVGNNQTSQGRSLSDDAYGNMATGYSDGTYVYFMVSHDLGSTFGDPIQVAQSTVANASINTTNGDVLFLYERDGKVYLRVYGGLLNGYSLKVSNSSLFFNADEGQDTQDVTITNSSDSALPINSITGTGDFTVDSSSVGSSLAAGQSAVLHVTFKHSSVGTSTGSIDINYGSPAQDKIINLTGQMTKQASATPTISQEPQNTSSTVGGTATFTVQASASDDGTLSYQWQKLGTDGNWTNIDEATDDSYTTDALTAADTGTQFRCIVTNSKDGMIPATATTEAASVSVAPAAVAPTIGTQPAGTTKNIGETATFAVQASASDGGTLTYQWQKLGTNSNWTNIDGATDDSYTTGALAAADTGAQFRCVVTNSKNNTTATATTDAAALTVNPAAVTPTIDTQPAGTAKNIGETATFAVQASASDSGALTYQWQKLTGGSWTDIDGATDDSYITGALTAADTGTQFRCVVTNSKNNTTANATTDAATLTVNPAATAATIGTQPAGTTKNIGETATFAVQASASDGGTLTYQWQISADGGKTWVDVTGATGASYATGALTAADNGTQFRCAVTNSKNGTISTATTDAATLQVNPAAVKPTISTQPSDTAQNIGNTATFSTGVTASDGGTLTYQWQTSTDGGKTWTNVTGATGASYTTGTLTTANNGVQFHCVVTNSKNGTVSTATTNAATLTVNPAAAEPTVGTQPSSTTQNVNDTATFSAGVTVSDGGTLTYQWQTSTDGGKTWTNVVGATGASYTTGTLTTANDGVQFRCAVTNSKNGTTSTITTSSVTLSVNSDLLSLENKIDALPDPNTASDQDIQNNEQNIKETKLLYDALDNSERDAIGSARKTKLDELIQRLNALLVVQNKDQSTGIEASGIGTSVLLPELSDPNIGKVLVQISVTPVSDASASAPANIAKAITIMSNAGKEILKTYDVSLLKSVFGTSGNLLTSGKVNNSDIMGYITIRIPVPASYIGQTNLSIAYIDDSGNVTLLPTTLVTADGVEYLEFETNHFSEYAIVANKSTETTQANPSTGNDAIPNNYAIAFAVLGAMIALSYLGTKIRRAN